MRALIDAAEADNQVARALLVQNNPVLVANREEALRAQARELNEAHARALQARDAAHARELEARDAAHARKAILDLCDVLAIEVSAERRARIDAMPSDELASLRSAIHTLRRWPEER